MVNKIPRINPSTSRININSAANDDISRMEHLLDCKETAEESGDTKLAKKIGRIIQAETTKSSYAKLRWATKGTKSPGLAAVHVKEPDGELKTITDPREMTPLLIEAGTRHFAQAEGTPFTTGPLADIEYTACCVQAGKILEGCSSFSRDASLPKAIRQWISHAVRVHGRTEEDVIDCWLNPEEVREGYSKWDEHTSTSPAGDHLGIYKALARKLEKEEDSDGKLSQIQTEAWEVIAMIMNMGCTYGLTLPRWKEAVCVMIEKAPGNFLLQKLRRIFIMPSDYNLILGIVMGRRLMWHAEQHRYLNVNLWGSICGRCAPDASMMKELTYDTARLTNTPLATFDNDAKACYDRIIMKVALMLARRLGLPVKTAQWMAETTAAMRNRIKTAYGISTDSFFRKHGPGQGNRMGPALWIVVSSYAFDELEETGEGVSFADPTNSILHHRVADAYVDDVTGFFNLFFESIRGDSISVERMAKGMEADAEAWNTQLDITGGALEHSKCFWYLLFQTWSEHNRRRYLTKSELEEKGASISVSVAGTDKFEPIELKDCSVPHKTLGAWKTIDGSQQGQITALREKSEKFGKAIEGAPLTMHEARMAEERLLIPSLEFALASATLSRSECLHVLQPGIKACMRKAGFASTTPKSIIFGPRELGGAAFTSLYAAQSTSQITLLIHHLRENREAANLIRINLGWCQLLAGIQHPILTDCDTPLPHMDKNWILSIRQALRDCNGKIEIHNAPQFPLLRERDEYIMERALSFQVRRPRDLQAINHCRLYCGVITLADASTADGRRLARPVYECSTRNFRGSKLLWPCLPTPTNHQKSIWRAFLAQCFLMKMPSAKQTKGRATPNRLDLQLEVELGRWIASPLSRQRFGEIVSRGRRMFRSDKGYAEKEKSVVLDADIECPYFPWERFDGRKKNDARWPPLPKHGITWNSIAWIGSDSRPKKENLLRSNTRECWMEDFICNVKEESKDSLSLLAGCPYLLACSDGGAEEGKGSFGWALKDKNSDRRFLVGIGEVDGSNPSSYRCECAGILSVMCIWDCLMNDGILSSSHRVQLLCDNEGVVKMTKKLLAWPNTPLPRDAPEADLLYCMKYMAPRCKDYFSIEWVRSHQDEKPDCKLSDLSDEARLNILADKLATHALKQASIRRVVKLKEPARCDLIIDGRSITSRRNKTIKSKIDHGILKRSIMQRNGWEESLFEKVDWRSLGAALSSFNNSHQVTLVKHCNCLLPLGKTLLHRDAKENPCCASCNQGIEESFDHMLSCGAHAREMKHLEAEFESSLVGLGTPRILLSVILNSFFDHDDCAHKSVSEVRNDCILIGRSELWRGRPPLSAQTAFRRLKKGRGDG